MTEHTGLPVKGYQTQSAANAAVVNVNKELEERVLRQLDDMAANSDFDSRMVALARTNVQTAFMWANRAVFQPGRVALPEDAMTGWPHRRGGIPSPRFLPPQTRGDTR